MSQPTDDTERKHRGLIPFKPGQSGNPAGRPKGARSKLGEQFCQDVYEKWQEAGSRCIDEMIADKPGDFVKLVATMLPKEMNLTVSDGSDLSDEELHERIRNLASQLAPFIGNGTGTADAGTESKVRSAKPAGIH